MQSKKLTFTSKTCEKQPKTSSFPSEEQCQLSTTSLRRSEPPLLLARTRRHRGTTACAAQLTGKLHPAACMALPLYTTVRVARHVAPPWRQQRKLLSMRLCTTELCCAHLSVTGHELLSGSTQPCAPWARTHGTPVLRVLAHSVRPPTDVPGRSVNYEHRRVMPPKKRQPLTQWKGRRGDNAKSRPSGTKPTVRALAHLYRGTLCQSCRASHARLCHARTGCTGGDGATPAHAIGCARQPGRRRIRRQQREQARER